ncbi:hypothetical protein ACJX0J_042587, partial [Zea mays]
IESEDSKVSVGNAAKQSYDVVGVGIDCIFNHAKVSTEADLGPQSDVIHLTSLDVPNESSQISSDADMVEQNKQDALDTLIIISQHKKPKKLNVARFVSEDYKCTPEDVQLIEYIKTSPGKQVVVNIDSAWLNRNDMECLFHGDIQLSDEALSAYIHCIRGEEHLLHREGGKVFLENTFISSLLKRDGDPKHCSLSPLPPYEPAFDWENERSLIFGQRVPKSIPAISNSGLKITVKVLSLSFQAGLVEDFYFHILPTDMQDAQGSLDRRGVFSLDTHPPSVCLFIQLEKAATEEEGVTPSVYSHKEHFTLDGNWTPSKTTLFCLFVMHSCVIHVWGHTQIAFSYHNEDKKRIFVNLALDEVNSESSSTEVLAFEVLINNQHENSALHVLHLLLNLPIVISTFKCVVFFVISSAIKIYFGILIFHSLYFGQGILIAALRGDHYFGGIILNFCWWHASMAIYFLTHIECGFLTICVDSFKAINVHFNFCLIFLFSKPARTQDEVLGYELHATQFQSMISLLSVYKNHVLI